ncbi:hypothetical protein DFH06DRAFT_1344098 [Mycena polygramma]|nr:hypothetical protein DFH06DRAFT_1344098 [Mycena polygramma]
MFLTIFLSSARRCRSVYMMHYIWPFSFILPFDQTTSLTLSPISLSVFSECIRNCPRLLYFNAVISPRLGEVVQQMAELRSPLHKLVLQGRGCQEVIVTHTFPRLLSLAIDLHALHPELCAFLARSSRLEMLSVRASGSLTTENLVALLLATPSLGILHFRDSHTAMVTPRFHAPLVVPPPDDPFNPECHALRRGTTQLSDRSTTLLLQRTNGALSSSIYRPWPLYLGDMLLCLSLYCALCSSV